MQEQESLQPVAASRMQEMEEAVVAYNLDLLLNDGVLEYLAARGVTEEEVNTYRLGVVGEPRPGHSKFKGYLVIPYLDMRTGLPVSMRFRCLQEHNHRDYGHGKYMSIPDEPPRLYGSADIGRDPSATEIHVTEGELDRIVLKKLGLLVVAVPGANIWQSRHVSMLRGFQDIWIWGDPDDAGTELVNRITRALPRAKSVRLRIGDVTETYQAGGERALLDLLEAAKDV